MPGNKKLTPKEKAALKKKKGKLSKQVTAVLIATGDAPKKKKKRKK